MSDSLHEQLEPGVAAQITAWGIAVAGWEATRVSLWDGEAEGWRWDYSVTLADMYVIGDWGEPPAPCDALIEAYRQAHPGAPAPQARPKIIVDLRLVGTREVEAHSFTMEPDQPTLAHHFSLPIRVHRVELRCGYR